MTADQPALTAHDQAINNRTRLTHNRCRQHAHAPAARLRVREVELAGAIVTHKHWSEVSPAEILAARDALKHHHEHQVETPAG
ncbi:hypothetical protein AB0I51_40910 [Streptomyces sp. NPDC050549]|uniref:hypothetical protein n=1 Tax=Streptomyces sp. NPDC050549 TaxID=3155406 RepID=UPI003418AA5B